MNKESEKYRNIKELTLICWMFYYKNMIL